VLGGFGALSFRHDRPVTQDENPVGNAEQLFEFRGHDHDACAPGGEATNVLEDLGLRANVDTGGRLIEKEYLGRRR
jgi:hypothetical protein